ncbi:cytochrome P450 [Streptomyces yaizuensis]|uniref:Cytochrome P450 n=1 Tax=Streptomyces yaizuensis TaxID=2989713 RepID=A0ABQ5NYK3_9ACTN|nr:cytochrome P450 [Streptomyces sp. YSPA8]GLF95302.1 cytochrome P450 [Streptomyces sp. YSPA8]
MTDDDAAHPADAGPSAPSYPLPKDPARPLDPPPAYRALRASDPITRVRAWDGSSPWLITRYEDARRAHLDRRLVADVKAPGYPHISASSRVRGEGVVPFPFTPPEQYAARRALYLKEFHPGRVAELRPFVQRVTDERIDAMLAGKRPADLLRDLALPLATQTVCELLGMSSADRDALHRLSRTVASRTAPAQEVARALTALEAHFHALVADRRDGRDGLIGRIVRDHVRTGELDEHDAAADLMILFFAGHGPTAYMIAAGAVALLRHPRQIGVLTGTDDERAHAVAIHELLRYVTVSHNARQRVATESLELGGQLIRAGEGVLIQTDSANRDERRFPHPDRLDLGRAEAPRHLSLGLGRGHCVGHALAHLELDVTFTTLFRRIPGLRLATGLAEVPFIPDENLLGVAELPATWPG